MKRTLLMMRTRGLIQPMVKSGSKAATRSARTGAKSSGPYIIYKQNNP